MRASGALKELKRPVLNLKSDSGLSILCTSPFLPSKFLANLVTGDSVTYFAAT